MTKKWNDGMTDGIHNTDHPITAIRDNKCKSRHQPV